MSALSLFQASILMLSAAITAFLLVRLSRTARSTPFAPLIVSAANRYESLMVLLGAIFVWQSTQALEYVYPEHAVALHRIGFIGVALVAPAALRLSQWVKGAAWPALPLVYVPAVLTLAINFSGSHADFFWSGSLTDSNPPGMIGTRGPWFWVHTGYSYFCLAGAFLLIGSHYREHTLRWREGTNLAIALALPVLANVLELSVSGLGNVAVTPIALGGTAMLLSWTTLRDSTRDLLPRARQQIIDAMGDPVFVVDGDKRLIFANRSGYDLLGLSAGEAIGLASFPSLAEFMEASEAEGDISFEQEGEPRHFHAVRSYLDEGDEVAVLVLRDVTQDREAQERITHLAYFDALTGLPNRRLFQRRVDAAIEYARTSKTMLGLLVIDVDRFKHVNDTFGHTAGDRLLQVLSEVFLDALRPQDEISSGPQSSVSRVGGDEFVVLLSGLRERANAMKVAERLGSKLDRPITLESEEMFASISTGIAIYPDDGDNARDLIRRADHAMYQAKQKPGSSACFATEEGDPNGADRRAHLGLEYSLRRALENREFQLFYQPVEAASDGALLGAEALLRWRHPDGRVIGPTEFIDRAEDSGLIVPIGRWVIETAVEQVNKWHDYQSEFTLKVNVSPIQLRHEDFLRELEVAAGRLHDPSSLELELTERVLMNDLEACDRSLNRINEMGIRLSLDDFGTGYSSLSYLHRLPFETVKIDRSFVSGLPDCTRSSRICRAIIEMAHGLDLHVIAEGIESQAQLTRIRDLDCDAVQGFLIGRPAEASTIDEAIERERERREIFAPELD